MNTLRTAFAFASIPWLALTAHCASASTTPQTSVSVPAGSSEPVEMSPATSLPSAAAPVLSTEPPAPLLPPMLQREGGVCAPFEPVKSTEVCGADADCAPAELCHARSCTAASKAPKKAPGTMCTMNLVCQSIDVGRCACVDKTCALVSR